MSARPIGLHVLAHMLAMVTVGCTVATIVAGFQQGDAVVDDLLFVLLLVVTLAVGWLLAVRLPRHPVGWVLMAVPALFTSEAALNLIEVAAGPSAKGLDHWIDWYNGSDADPSWSWLPPVWLLLVELPLRFPTGRLPSPRWRLFAWASVGVLVVTVLFLGTASPLVYRGLSNPAYLPVMHALVPLLPACYALVAGCIVTSIVSLFVRYRGARALERAQLRWMMWAVALSLGGLALGNIIPAGWDAVQSVALGLYALVPIAVAIAVLRYRLYEIDRLISRTAAYAVVTLVVVGTYALVVLLVGLLPGLRSFGVALATLAAAAVFLPVLRWVRHGIDRVFDRAQYNAEKVVVAFGERIRNGADPQTAGADLLGAVGQTLQPSAIGLWVRDETQ